jgi:endonuclease/exonuclease/phosphatase family metal-dependent hydrolase
MRRLSKGFLPMIIVFFMFLYLLHVYYDATYAFQHREDTISFFEPIKVVTYNIRYGKGIDGQIDLNRTVNKLKALDADIISLQEVERYSLRTGFIDQVDLLAKKLNMNAVFYPSLSYPGFYFGNAIITRFPIRSSEMIPLYSQLENRSLILAELEVAPEQKIIVMNTHLGLDQNERVRHLKKISKLILSLEDPVILTGDLNTTPEQPDYASLDQGLTRSNYEDSLRTFYKLDSQLDYIFHSSHFYSTETRTIESNTSDHFPVKAFLQFK